MAPFDSATASQTNTQGDILTFTNSSTTVAGGSISRVEDNVVYNPPILNKAAVGLDQVDNESKADMFTTPTFTGNGATFIGGIAVNLNNTDVFKVDYDGATTTAAPFTVKHSNTDQFKVESNLTLVRNAVHTGQNTYFAQRGGGTNPNNADYNWRCRINDHGHIQCDYDGIQSSNLNNNVHIDGGGGVFVHSVQLTSDDRFKINERPITGAIDSLMNLQFFEYEKLRKKTDTEGFATERGVIAQQLQGTELDFAIGGGEEERFFVDYQNINSTVAQAVKDLVSQVRELEAKVTALEARVDV